MSLHSGRVVPSQESPSLESSHLRRRQAEGVGAVEEREEEAERKGEGGGDGNPPQSQNRNQREQRRMTNEQHARNVRTLAAKAVAKKEREEKQEEDKAEVERKQKMKEAEDQKEREKKRALGYGAPFRLTCVLVYNVVSHMLCVWPDKVYWNGTLCAPVFTALALDLLYFSFRGIPESLRKRNEEPGDSDRDGLQAAQRASELDQRPILWHCVSHFVSGVVGFFFLPGANFLPCAAAFPLFFFVVTMQNLVLDRRDRKQL